MKPRAADGGFTVLESIIAFVILVGLMTAMMDLVRGSVGVVDRTERIRVATEAARSVLARVGNDIPAEPGETDLRDGPVAITVVQTAVLSQQLTEWQSNALLVTVTARHDDGGQPVTLETINIDGAEVY